MISPYLLHLVTLVAIYGILAMAFNLAMGYGGILQFGHIAIFGIGAYISAILTKTYHLPFFVALPSAMVGAAFVTAILGILIRRVRGDFMALVTLFFGLAVVEIFLQWESMTRGALGIAAITRPSFVATPGRYAVLALFFLALTYLVLLRITRSPFGLVLGAVRDDAIGAAVLGKNVAHIKRAAFITSGLFAGLAGTLFAHFVQFIDPSSFHLNDIVLIVTAVVVGGLGSLEGSILGVCIYFLIPEVLRAVHFSPEVLGAVRQIIFSTLLLVIILVRPKGIMGKVSLE